MKMFQISISRLKGYHCNRYKRFTLLGHTMGHSMVKRRGTKLLNLILVSVLLQFAQSATAASRVGRSSPERNRAKNTDAARPALSLNGVRYGMKPILCRYIVGKAPATTIVKSAQSLRGTSLSRMKNILDAAQPQPLQTYTKGVEIRGFHFNLIERDAVGSKIPAELEVATDNPYSPVRYGAVSLASRLPQEYLGLSIGEVRAPDMLSVRTDSSKDYPHLRPEMSKDGSRTGVDVVIPSLLARSFSASTQRLQLPSIALSWSSRYLGNSKNFLERLLNDTSVRTFESQLVLKFVEATDGDGIALRPEYLSGLFPSLFRPDIGDRYGHEIVVQGSNYVHNYIPAVPPFLVEIYPSSRVDRTLWIEISTLGNSQGKLSYEETAYKDPIYQMQGTESVRRNFFQIAIDPVEILHLEIVPKITMHGTGRNPFFVLKIHTVDRVLEAKIPIDFTNPKSMLTDNNRLFTSREALVGQSIPLERLPDNLITETFVEASFPKLEAFE